MFQEGRNSFKLIGNSKMQSLMLLILFLQLAVPSNQYQNNGLVQMNLNLNTVARRTSPCDCSKGQCSCCSGFFLGQLGVNLDQKGCVNVAYDPDEFAFTTALTYNNKVLYKNKFSGKNPEPMCVTVPRTNLRFCVAFSNVYFAGRNVHMCIDMQMRWQDISVTNVPLDCIRVGANGVAVVKPEDGGGLPANTFNPDDEDIEDYDDTEDADIY
ncbi:hypothetical protein C0J52_07764 [Blattella germanica]|nr:hypothetical protein C0J52_07764 [Blattella germanica]